MKNIIFLLLFLVVSKATFAGDREGRTFETRGTAVVFTDSTFTVGIEKRDIPVPLYFDVESNPVGRGMTHDSSSGSWTKCRVPLKSEMTWQGVKERHLVFDCRPLTFYR